MSEITEDQSSFSRRYGPWALVTGAASGIGREIVLQLAESGLHLVLVDMLEEPLHQLASTLETNHRIEVRTLVLDLRREGAMGNMESEITDLDLGLLVAAAGFGSSGRLVEANIDDEVDMLRVNCRAILEQAHFFGNRFAKRGRGGIVFMSSSLAFQGAPLSGNYAATKAYVQSLAEALQVELAPSGVDVLSSAPGPVATNFAQRARLNTPGMLDPKDVARETLRALGRKQTILPGLRTKFATHTLNTFPRPMRVRIIGSKLEKMTNHKPDSK